VNADLVDQIDALTAPVCGWCQQTLNPDGPSPYFCCEEHQHSWRFRRSAGWATVGVIADCQAAADALTWAAAMLDDAAAVNLPMVTTDWRPPENPIAVRLDYDDGCWGLGGFGTAVRLSEPRWYLTDSDGSESQVPEEIVAEAMPITVTRAAEGTREEQLQEQLRQVTAQFALAAARVRSRYALAAQNAWPQRRVVAVSP
jgi:hypothetical protein